jgi:hypothetical protein
MRGFDTKTILDKHDTGFSLTDNRSDSGGVINDIGKGLSRYNDVVPSIRRRVWRARGVRDRGVDGVWLKGVGAEIASLELNAGFGDCAVV